MMRKPKLPNFVILLILTALTAVMWVGLSIYRSFTIKPAPIVSEEVLRPINPVLDQTIIREIESRVVAEPVITEPVSENENLDIEISNEEEAIENIEIE